MLKKYKRWKNNFATIKKRYRFDSLNQERFWKSETKSFAYKKFECWCRFEVSCEEQV